MKSVATRAIRPLATESGGFIFLVPSVCGTRNHLFTTTDTSNSYLAIEKGKKSAFAPRLFTGY
jgi:hypothetical protein